jgi:hypothetical protein
MAVVNDSLLREQIRNNPADAEVRFALAQHYFQMQKWNALHRLVEETIKSEGISDPERGRIVMLEFISYYLRHKMDETPKYFSLANHLNEAVKQNPDRYGNMHIFYMYLLRLLQYRQENKELYQSNGNKILHIVGDSHALGTHGMIIGKAKCQAQLVMGCKAFHVKEWADNQYYGYLQRKLQTVPPQSDVMMVLGEIDCRVDGGIVPYALKSGDDVKLVAERTAREYVKCLSGSSHDMAFMTVPPLSPHRVVNTANQEESYRALIILVRDAIEYFNDSLRTTCKELGHKVVDVYQESVGPNRIARPDTHIDNIHLKPHVVMKAIENAY